MWGLSRLFKKRAASIEKLAPEPPSALPPGDGWNMAFLPYKIGALPPYGQWIELWRENWDQIQLIPCWSKILPETNIYGLYWRLSSAEQSSPKEQDYVVTKLERINDEYDDATQAVLFGLPLTEWRKLKEQNDVVNAKILDGRKEACHFKWDTSEY